MFGQLLDRGNIETASRYAPPACASTERPNGISSITERGCKLQFRPRLETPKTGMFSTAAARRCAAAV